MKLKAILILLVAMVFLGIASAANALEPGDPVPPSSWKMNLSKTKYIGDGCWREWKYVKCLPYGNYGENRYNPTYNIRSLKG
jgi:hypothetical protein